MQTEGFWSSVQEKMRNFKRDVCVRAWVRAERFQVHVPVV